MNSLRKPKTDTEDYTGPLTIDGHLPGYYPPNPCFTSNQGESYPEPISQTPAHYLSIHLIQLDNGKWIASPTRVDSLCASWNTQYADRETALRKAVAEVIKRIRYKARKTDSGMIGFQIDTKQANELIAWAYSLISMDPPPILLTPSIAEPTSVIRPLRWRQTTLFEDV